MLNRLTVSALLKAVILTTALCVIFAVAAERVESWSAWRRPIACPWSRMRRRTCSRRWHNLRTDRPYTGRALNGEQPLDREAEKYLRDLATINAGAWRARWVCFRPSSLRRSRHCFPSSIG